MVKIGLKYFRRLMNQICTGIQQVFEMGGTGTSTADWEEVFENCTSFKEQEQLEMMSRFSEGAMPWETAKVFTIPRSLKKTGHLIFKPSALEHKTSAIRKELEVGQASLDVFKRREHYRFKRGQSIRQRVIPL